MACGPVALAGPGCRPTSSGIAFPDDLRESSGVAVCLRHPGTFWTHNDAGSVLYAVDRDGSITARFPLADRLRDWEDLALSTCPEDGSCLYLADLGDNYEERAAGRIQLLRIPEPDPTASGVDSTGSGADPTGAGVEVDADGRLASESFPIRLPDGPRDIEALVVLPGERVFFVTKGRNHPVTVYRYPPPLRPDTVTLEQVQQLTTRARIVPRQVTGGASDPRGTVLALRTYESLQFYRIEGDTLAAIDGALVNLRTLQEGQGEAVGIGLDGLVVLTSEGGPLGGPGSMTLMRCNLERL